MKKEFNFQKKNEPQYIPVFFRCPQCGAIISILGIFKDGMLELKYTGEEPQSSEGKTNGSE